MAYQNFFAAKLYNDIGASDNEIILDTTPTATSGRMTLEARNPTQREIIKYTGLTGNKLTGVSRGQGGTTAKPHLKNALIEMNLTAEDLEDAINVPNDIATRFQEALSDFIANGTGVIITSANLTTSLSDIVYYISGYRYTKTGIANNTYTASKDTYVSIDTNGTVTYQAVANNAAQPTLPASSIWIAKVVTDATKVASVVLMSRGSVGSSNIDFTTFGIATGTIATTATSKLSVTGLGFKPRSVEFQFISFGGFSTTGSYQGWGIMTANGSQYTQSIYSRASNGNIRYASTSNCLSMVNSSTSGPYILGTFTSMDNDGFTIAVTGSGSVSDMFVWIARQ